MVHSHVRHWLSISILSSSRIHNPNVNSIRFHIGTRIHYGFIPAFIILSRYIIFNSGFTLVNTYVAGSAYSNALFSFLILVFTIQYYFIIRSFWIGVGLGNDSYNNTLGTGEPKMIRIHTTDFRLNSSVNTNIGMT